jgi:hypothetical protein
LNSLLPVLFFFPSPTLGIVSAGIILHLYTCVHSFCMYSPSYLIFLPPPPSFSCQHSPGRTWYAFLFSDSVEEKRKKWHFCFFEIKVAAEGVS